MSKRFLVDSCSSKFVVEALRNQQPDVVWIPESEMDPGDGVILQRANTEDRILITADKDFGDLVFVYNKPHPTIIRLVDIPPKRQMQLLTHILQNYSEEMSKRVLITANSSRVRIKYPDDE